MEKAKTRAKSLRLHNITQHCQSKVRKKHTCVAEAIPEDERLCRWLFLATQQYHLKIKMRAEFHRMLKHPPPKKKNSTRAQQTSQVAGTY